MCPYCLQDNLKLMYFLNFTSPNVNERCMVEFINLATDRIAFLLGFFFFLKLANVEVIGWHGNSCLVGMKIFFSFSWGCCNSDPVWVHKAQTYKFCPFFFLVPWTNKSKNPSFLWFPGSCFLEEPFVFAGISCPLPEFRLRLLICDRGVPSATFFYDHWTKTCQSFEE